MSKRAKNVLFFILVILFLLAAPTTLLYSWGYRFDFEDKKITQTGGFYFKVWPKSSQIVIDGKPSKRTDFFFGAAYLDNILPKKYEIEIQKEGYSSWKKILEVKESQVTDAKNIVLFTLNPQFSLLDSEPEVLNLLEKALAVKVSPDSRKLAYPLKSEVWVLFLRDELSQPQKSSGERLLVARFSEKIGQVFWLTSHYLIFTAGDKIKIAEIDDRDGMNIVDWASFKEPKIFFNQSDKKLYILSEGNLYSSEKLLP